MSEDKPELGFESLACYQHAQKLFDAAYRFARHLPDFERYNLAAQLRRAALSAMLNIAEGYGRYHYLEKVRFLYIARGSLSETLCAFLAAHHLGYMNAEQMGWVRSIEAEAEKSLNGYINFIRKQQQGSAEFGNRIIHDEQAGYLLGMFNPLQEPTPEDLITDH